MIFDNTDLSDAVPVSGDQANRDPSSPQYFMWRCQNESLCEVKHLSEVDDANNFESIALSLLLHTHASILTYDF